jgi:glycosyltransferase involved in cell wall biosynthesis
MKKISIIVPVYNEEKTVGTMIEKLKSVELPLEKEIIVVDDKSADNSLNILKKLEDIILLKHDKNMGKGAAVKTGLDIANGDIIMIQDADLEYSPKDIAGLIKPIIERKCEVVYGSRFLKKGNNRWKIPSHYIGNKLLSFLTTLLYGCKITDMETCYKIFSKGAMEKIKKAGINAKGFEFEPEITAKTLKLGYKITELPIFFNPRGFDEGKKVNWKDGIKAIYYLIYYRIFN